MTSSLAAFPVPLWAIFTWTGFWFLLTLVWHHNYYRTLPSPTHLGLLFIAIRSIISFQSPLAFFFLAHFFSFRKVTFFSLLLAFGFMSGKCFETIHSCRLLKQNTYDCIFYFKKERDLFNPVLEVQEYGHQELLVGAGNRTWILWRSSKYY